MSFEKLLEEINTESAEAEALAKSFGDKKVDDEEGADDDKKIADAAADGGAGAELPGADDDEKKAKDAKPLAKSFKVQLEDGEEVEAIDATEMLKSLQEQVATFSGIETKMTAVMQASVELIKKQGQMIKSLHDDVRRIGSEGKGRKAVVTVAEKGGAEVLLNKALEITMDDFMGKALVAQKDGKITGLDVARIESYANRGMTIPDELKSRVLS